MLKRSNEVKLTSRVSQSDRQGFCSGSERRQESRSQLPDLKTGSNTLQLGDLGQVT